MCCAVWCRARATGLRHACETRRAVAVPESGPQFLFTLLLTSAFKLRRSFLFPGDISCNLRRNENVGRVTCYGFPRNIPRAQIRPSKVSRLLQCVVQRTSCLAVARRSPVGFTHFRKATKSLLLLRQSHLSNSALKSP